MIISVSFAWLPLTIWTVRMNSKRSSSRHKNNGEIWLIELIICKELSKVLLILFTLMCKCSKKEVISIFAHEKHIIYNGFVDAQFVYCSFGQNKYFGKKKVTDFIFWKNISKENYRFTHAKCFYFFDLSCFQTFMIDRKAMKLYMVWHAMGC